ncbi:hypothetical protein [Naasia sp. SYSU D00948]|uniref:AAA family ATPase n=1 Tax=Naasia sp. SYSU D00948 TaxID=2817379 RepID=UPI001B30ECDF|nr:hypothetical protein [Naasia sp. SYSU D00948]
MELVFLQGPAASGKLTTARALAESTGFALFHNHLVVDTLLAVFPFGSAPFVRLRDRFWISTLTEAALAGRSLVFTFTPEPTVPADFPSRARRAVEDNGGRVVFVELTVSEAEQEARIENPDRAAYRKLASVETLRRIRATGDGWTRREPIPTDLSIATDSSAPADSARAIVAAFGLRPVEGHEPYPG